MQISTVHQHNIVPWELPLKNEKVLIDIKIFLKTDYDWSYASLYKIWWMCCKQFSCNGDIHNARERS